MCFFYIWLMKMINFLIRVDWFLVFGRNDEKRIWFVLFLGEVLWRWLEEIWFLKVIIWYMWWFLFLLVRVIWWGRIFMLILLLVNEYFGCMVVLWWFNFLLSWINLDLVLLFFVVVFNFCRIDCFFCIFFFIWFFLVFEYFVKFFFSRFKKCVCSIIFYGDVYGW